MRSPCDWKSATRMSLFAVALVIASGAEAPSWGRSLKQELAPTGADPDARGKAGVAVARHSQGRLKIQARRLSPRATYEIVLEGVRIGTLRTTRGGNGVANFSTRPRGRTQRLGADPRGRLLEIRDDDGDDVLLGELPKDLEAEGKVRCCLADEEDDEDEEESRAAECEATTPEECVAEGGVDMGEGSCLPNPCATVASEGVVCCVLEDEGEGGPECELSTTWDCAAEGGTSLGGTSCEPNPCAPVSPPEGLGACCLPDEEDGRIELECERVSADACSALGGTVSGVPTCGPDACAP